MQTNWNGEELTQGNWKEQVWRKLESLNWASIVDDVRPFVEPGFDLNLLGLASFESILGA